jgi:hypothetical protein
MEENYFTSAGDRTPVIQSAVRRTDWATVAHAHEIYYGILMNFEGILCCAQSIIFLNNEFIFGLGFLRVFVAC